MVFVDLDFFISPIGVKDLVVPWTISIHAPGMLSRTWISFLSDFRLVMLGHYFGILACPSNIYSGEPRLKNKIPTF